MSYWRGFVACSAGAFFLMEGAPLVASYMQAENAKKRRSQQEPGLVYLHTFPRSPLMLQYSLPCLKLETYLRLAGIPYELVPSSDPSTVSPTARFPAVEVDGVVLTESEAIIETLGATPVGGTRPVKGEHELTPSQRAKGTAIRRVAEDSLHWYLKRCLVADNLDALVPHVRGALPTSNPGAARGLTDSFVRQPIIKALNEQGVGDMSPEHYHREWLRDVQTLEVLMCGEDAANGKPPSRAGFAVTEDAPTTYDATAFAFLYGMRQLSKQGVSAPALDYFAQSPGLQDYVERVQATAFPDHDAILGFAGVDPKQVQRFQAPSAVAGGPAGEH